MDKKGTQLLKAQCAEQTFSLARELLLKTADFEQAITQAQLLEQDTIMFYEFLLNLVSDEEARLQLEQVIKEEKRHVEQLGEIKAAGPESCRNLALA